MKEWQEIITRPLSTLPPDMVKRLERLYFISTPRKNIPRGRKSSEDFCIETLLQSL